MTQNKNLFDFAEQLLNNWSTMREEYFFLPLEERLKLLTIVEQDLLPKQRFLTSRQIVAVAEMIRCAPNLGVSTDLWAGVMNQEEPYCSHNMLALHPMIKDILVCAWKANQVN